MMEQESRKTTKGVVSMGEIVRVCFVMVFVLTILEPAPTLWERVFLSASWFSGGVFLGYLFRKIKLWRIARAAEIQKA